MPAQLFHFVRLGKAQIIFLSAIQVNLRKIRPCRLKQTREIRFRSRPSVGIQQQPLHHPSYAQIESSLGPLLHQSLIRRKQRVKDTGNSSHPGKTTALQPPAESAEGPHGHSKDDIVFLSG